MCCLLCMQVQFLREKFSSLDIEMDGGLSPSTIDTASQMCACARACVSVVLHASKKGKDLVNCIYRLCPATLYGVVQSHCSSLSHDPLHHCLSSNGSLENSERKLGHLFCYCRSCKTLQLYTCASQGLLVSTSQ